MQALPNGHPGFTAVPTWLLGQASPIELAILLAIQEAPDQQISLAELAAKAGIAKSSVCRVMHDLMARGWLAKEATTAEDGGIGPNRYILKIWGRQAAAPAPADSPPRRLQDREPRQWGNASAPVELMAHCVGRKGALFVYLALQLFEAPTISTLATVCGMAPDSVRRSLQWLEAEGWIQRIEQPGNASRFRVFFQRIGAYLG